MPEIRNILFVMFDQLRFDYLGCYGHRYIDTPNIDALAAKGVLFSRAYVQSPVCGPSRMSFYTGRYMQSHGSVWNLVPLRAGEITLGDHLRALGMDCWLVGKTHMAADDEGMTRLGIERGSVVGGRIAECGFDVYERDDGMRPEGPDGLYDPRGALNYNNYLRAQGYVSANPWHDFANAGRTEDGEMLSGWFLKNSQCPAAVREEDSETPYMTGRAIEFMEAHQDKPWCLHLSYIKPHWPYIAPAPYHEKYDSRHVVPAIRSEREREEAHPVFKAFMDGRIGQAFSRDEVRSAVIPAYMGLIAQCDDQMGRLFDYMERSGLMDDTLIVISSDHGDYLGDHWLGEKDLFHEPSVRMPLIIYDPRSDANATRGSVCDELVEAIDLAPTFVEALGATPRYEILEGRSLIPFLHGKSVGAWREFAVSEYDYSITPAASRLGVEPKNARLFMIADKQWKFMHAIGFRPQLFDLQNDRDELVDVAERAEYEDVLNLMYARLGRWGIRQSQRVTVSDADLIAKRGRTQRKGVTLGVVEPEDIPLELTAFYRGLPRQPH